MSEVENQAEQENSDTEENQENSAAENTGGEGEGTPAAEGTEGEVEAKAGTEGAEGAEGEAAAAEGEEGEPAAEEFKPNLKYKAVHFDPTTKKTEQREYDIDPKFAPFMKDAETEKLVRELHERATGIEGFRLRHQSAREELKAVSEENSGLKSYAQRMGGIYQKAVKSDNFLHMDQFFDMLKIPHEHIYKYVHAKLQLAEMDPAQRQAILGQMTAERQNEEMTSRQSSSASEADQLLAKNLQLEIDLSLVRPEVSPLVELVDTQMGKPGFFREQVRREGELAWAKGEQLTPEECVKRVIDTYGLDTETPRLPARKAGNPAPPTPGQNGGTKTAGAANGTQTGSKKPATTTIPNLSGRTTSPLKAKPSSIADLKKMYKETYETESTQGG